MIDAGTTIPIQASQCHPSMAIQRQESSRIHTADAQSGHNEDTPELVEIVRTRNRQRATTGCHQNRGDDEQLLVVTSENRQQPKHDASAYQDRESDWNTANPDSDGVMAVYVECLNHCKPKPIVPSHQEHYLCRPKHQNGEEVSSRNECNDQSEAQNARVLAQALWKHWMLCAICFPQNESNDEDEAKDQWGESVRRAPGILIPA